MLRHNRLEEDKFNITYAGKRNVLVKDNCDDLLKIEEYVVYICRINLDSPIVNRLKKLIKFSNTTNKGFNIVQYLLEVI